MCRVGLVSGGRGVYDSYKRLCAGVREGGGRGGVGF